MPEEKKYPLSDEARAEWERVWGRRYTTDYAPWEQRCAKMILDMDSFIRELQAEREELKGFLRQALLLMCSIDTQEKEQL